MRFHMSDTERLVRYRRWQIPPPLRTAPPDFASETHQRRLQALSPLRSHVGMTPAGVGSGQRFNLPHSTRLLSTCSIPHPKADHPGSCKRLVLSGRGHGRVVSRNDNIAILNDLTGISLRLGVVCIRHLSEATYDPLRSHWRPKHRSRRDHHSGSRELGGTDESQ